MYRQIGGNGFSDVLDRCNASAPPVDPGELDALVTLDRIGSLRSFRQDEEIYAEADASTSWYKVIAGTVRVCKLLADGQRHITEFCFAGDCFGLKVSRERALSAEAVGEVIVMRYRRQASEPLLDDDPRLALRLCDMMLRDLAHAQLRMLRLGRMTAPERVANFLLEPAERGDPRWLVDVPMSRNDIADYLGLRLKRSVGCCLPSSAMARLPFPIRTRSS